MTEVTNIENGAKKTIKQWNLIRLRKEAGYTQPDIAKYLNINVATYSYKENGERDFIASEMFEISRLLNKPIEEIFLPPNSN